MIVEDYVETLHNPLELTAKIQQDFEIGINKTNAFFVDDYYIISNSAISTFRAVSKKKNFLIETFFKIILITNVTILST